MEKNELAQTNRLLKVMIALLIRGRNDEEITLREQITILNDLGVKPVEIAEILGRNNSYISKELAGIRKSQKQKK